MKIFLSLIFIFHHTLLQAFEIDEVQVFKTKHQMNFLFQGKIIKSYRVMLGRGGIAPKRQKGDNLVPEGQYFLDEKNAQSHFFKSIHLSYPNENDQRAAAEAGVDPGGDIMIHGLPNYPKPFFQFLKRIGLIKLINWTAGCIAVEDDEMLEIFDSIDIPIPITIFH